MAITSMRELLANAIAQRHAPADTDAFRLVDGAGDGLPGIELDTLAGRWLLSLRNRDIPEPLRHELAASGHSVYRKQLDQRQKQSPEHLCGPAQDDSFLVREHRLHFEVSFQSGYSQGLFLDQRDNRRHLRDLLQPGQTLLNTFAYTGAFSVAAAAAGAITTTLDLSQPYLDWAGRNFRHNELDPAEHYFCKGDAFHWLRRFAKQGRRFDAIILDPPTFSRDKSGKTFRVESDYGSLAALAARCLTREGVLLACTNCRALSPDDFEARIRGGIDRPVKIDRAPMPADFTGPSYLKSFWVRG